MRNIWLGAESRHSAEALRWGERTGRWRRVARGVYGDGPDDPSELDVAVGEVVRVGAVANGRLAGVLHGLDSVTLWRRRYSVRRRAVPTDRVATVGGIRCTDLFQTIVDLAAELDDLRWEQALESVLRRDIGVLDRLWAALPELGAARTPGTARSRRVLRRRGPGAATGSLLETLMVQLARRVAGLGPPVRQYEVRSASGGFIAFVDLAWPELGVFLELDGQQHAGQPVYDALRQTRVAAATGWLCGRFTWYQVTQLPETSLRQLGDLVGHARRLSTAV